MPGSPGDTVYHRKPRPHRHGLPATREAAGACRLPSGGQGVCRTRRSPPQMGEQPPVPSTCSSGAGTFRRGQSTPRRRRPRQRGCSIDRNTPVVRADRAPAAPACRAAACSAAGVAVNRAVANTPARVMRRAQTSSPNAILTPAEARSLAAAHRCPNHPGYSTETTKIGGYLPCPDAGVTFHVLGDWPHCPYRIERYGRTKSMTYVSANFTLQASCSA